jgi:hypothetical protein
MRKDSFNPTDGGFDPGLPLPRLPQDSTAALPLRLRFSPSPARTPTLVLRRAYHRCGAGERSENDLPFPLLSLL